MSFQETFSELPPPELLVERIKAYDDMKFLLTGENFYQHTTESYNNEELNITHFDDGGGNNVYIVKKNKNFIIWGYDHESERNSYGEIPELKKDPVLDSAPAEWDFVNNFEPFFWKFPSVNRVFATFAVWWDDDKKHWDYNHQIDYEDSFDDGGLRYFVKPFIGYSLDDFIDFYFVPDNDDSLTVEEKSQISDRKKIEIQQIYDSVFKVE